MNKAEINRAMLASYLVSMAQMPHEREPIHYGQAYRDSQKPQGNQAKLKKKKAKAKQIKRLHIMERRRRK